jgi:hypothetical protein
MAWYVETITLANAGRVVERLERHDHLMVS